MTHNFIMIHSIIVLFAFHIIDLSPCLIKFNLFIGA